MRRRSFLTLLGGTAVAWPLAARAQQPAMPVIGSLFGVSAAEWQGNMAGFYRGLNEQGFVEGVNVAIEYRWANNQPERLPALAADLVSRNVAALLAGGSIVGVRAAMAATETIPIIFTTNSDPVAAGIVTSINRPGRNVTGVTGIGGELLPKRLELLREVIPNATKFAVLVNPTNPVTLQDAMQGSEAAARRLGVEIIAMNARSEDEIETAFANAVRQGASAIAFVDVYFASKREQIAALGLRYSVATITGERDAVAAGILMSYGADISDSYRQAGVYVGRILKGEKPGDLPVQRPTKFSLVVNLKTAKAIGLTIPEGFLLRADEVIE